MAEPTAPDVLARVRKLARLPEEVRQSRRACEITRLTTLKSLCGEPALANRFVAYLARKALEQAGRGKGRSPRPGTAKDLAHRQMMAEAVTEMEAWLHEPTEARRQHLRELLARMRAEQDEHRSIPFGAVRLITDSELLIVEEAVECLLNPRAAGHWAYRTARSYAERYDPSYGTGLIPESVPPLQDIADFWTGLYRDELNATAAGRRRPAPLPGGPVRPAPQRPRARAAFTPRQGQFLAFIHLYRKLHRQGPAEMDLVQFFRVTPPAAHGMIVKLEQLGLVSRLPGAARSVRVTLPEEQIPRLEAVAGPPW
jgi:hypothetical protein